MPAFLWTNKTKGATAETLTPYLSLRDTIIHRVLVILTSLALRIEHEVHSKHKMTAPYVKRKVTASGERK